MTIEEKLSQMGLRLPSPHKYSKPNRTGCVVVGNLAYVSGHLPVTEAGERIAGKIDADLTEAQGYEASRRAALSMLSSLKAALGSLERVKRVVKVLGVVNASPGFQRPFAIIDGASDLFLDLWGPQAGVHARTTYGVAETSANIAVEVEGIFEIGD